jgi:hypothetical protein
VVQNCLLRRGMLVATGVGCAAATALAVGMAHAADLPVNGPVYEVPALVESWATALRLQSHMAMFGLAYKFN